MSNRLAKSLPWILGPLFLALSGVYLARFDWRSTWDLLVAFDPVWGCGVAGSTILGLILVRALRWRLLLAEFGVRVPYGRVYTVTAIGVALAIVTPLQGGELTKVEMLQRIASLRRLPAYSTLAVERILDLGCVLLLAIVGSLATRQWTALFPQLVWTAVIALALLAAAVLVLLVLPMRGRPAEIQRSFAAVWRRPGAGLSCLGLSLFGWLLVAACWYAVLRSIGLDLEGASVVTLTAVATLINVASLVPGAVGVSEVTITAMLRFLDTPPEQALAGALMIRGSALLLLAIGLVHLVIWVGASRLRRWGPP